MRSPCLILCSMIALLPGAAWALGDDPIGVEELRGLDPTLTGSGVVIVQAEALSIPGVTDDFEVNPASVDQPAGKFVYTGTDGSTSTTFSDSVGQESDHADVVGDYLYGDLNTADPEGVAPGIAKVENYDAGYFMTGIVAGNVPIDARIVNQSFVLDGTAANQSYDNYAATYDTLFISSIGNSGQVQSPASAYNGIGVAAYQGASATGPTADGRSKPDITAPGDATSDSTPLVTGAAAILLQAAQRGDAGAGTETDAGDARVLKALLLNGAVKPIDWSHTDTAPLDPAYGAGILNVYNSYENLAAGEYAPSGTTAGSAGSINTGAIVPDEGWDLSSVTTAFDGTSNYINQSNHYRFDLSGETAGSFTLTSTLTWWRQAGQSAINNLDLYLFDAATGMQIAISDSDVDNVEELYVQGLPPGEYDLVVLKNGGTSITGGGGTVVSAAETYAVAFNFAPATAPVPEGSACWLVLVGLAALPKFVRRRAR
jgi:hypothetical protein